MSQLSAHRGSCRLSCCVYCGTIEFGCENAHACASGLQQRLLINVAFGILPLHPSPALLQDLLALPLQAKTAAQAKQIKALTAELRMLGGKAPNITSRARGGSASSAASSDHFAATAYAGQHSEEQRLSSRASGSRDGGASGRGSPNGSAYATAADVLDLTGELPQDTPPEQPQQIPVEQHEELPTDVSAVSDAESAHETAALPEAAPPASASRHSTAASGTAPPPASTAAAAEQADRSEDLEQPSDGADHNCFEAEQPQSAAAEDTDASGAQPDAQQQAAELAAEGGGAPAQDTHIAEDAEAAADLAENGVGRGTHSDAYPYSTADSDGATLHQQEPAGDRLWANVSPAAASSGLHERGEAATSAMPPATDSDAVDEMPGSQHDDAQDPADAVAAAAQRDEQPVRDALSDQAAEDALKEEAGHDADVTAAAAEDPHGWTQSSEDAVDAAANDAVLQGGGGTWLDTEQIINGIEHNLGGEAAAGQFGSQESNTEDAGTADPLL